MTPFDTLAICLKSTPFREADRIVFLYSAHHGEMRAVAKGVKKPLSKLAGACEPLTLNHVFLNRGKELHTLCHTDRVESFSGMRRDLERMAVGSVCTDVIRRLGREDDPDSDAIFALLAQTLARLDDVDCPWVEASLSFHVQMLKLAGFCPDFSSCLHCSEAFDFDAVPYYTFYPSLYGFLCPTCTSITKDTHRVNVSSATLGLLLNPDDQTRYGNVQKAHRFMAYYWQQRLERPLASFEFLFELLDAQSLCPYPDANQK